MAVHHLPTPEPPPGRPRWGLRLPGFEAEGPSEPPEPIDWRPPPTMRERVFRAVSVPVLLGAAVFSLAVIVAIVSVFVRPNLPVSEDLADATVATAEATGGAAGLGDAASNADSANSPNPNGSGSVGGLAAGAPVFVHVVGEVHAPGVVELPAGSRVEAAIELAGGATPGAVLSGVNLARVVQDGEQIVVPNASVTATGPSGSTPPAGGTAIGSVINLNSADLAALESLPGVGPALAQRILDWRSTNGQFGTVEQLLEVAGIGAKTLEGLRDRVTV